MRGWLLIGFLASTLALDVAQNCTFLVDPNCTNSDCWKIDSDIDGAVRRCLVTTIELLPGIHQVDRVQFHIDGQDRHVTIIGQTPHAADVLLHMSGTMWVNVSGGAALTFANLTLSNPAAVVVSAGFSHMANVFCLTKADPIPFPRNITKNTTTIECFATDVPADYCAMYQECGGCITNTTCGWNSTSGRCLLFESTLSTCCASCHQRGQCVRGLGCNCTVEPWGGTDCSLRLLNADITVFLGRIGLGGLGFLGLSFYVLAKTSKASQYGCLGMILAGLSFGAHITYLSSLVLSRDVLPYETKVLGWFVAAVSIVSVSCNRFLLFNHESSLCMHGFYAWKPEIALLIGLPSNALLTHDLEGKIRLFSRVSLLRDVLHVLAVGVGWSYLKGWTYYSLATTFLTSLMVLFSTCQYQLMQRLTGPARVHLTVNRHQYRELAS